MRDSKESFGVQAARFSMYVPVAVLLIGCFSRGSRDQPSVVIALFWLNVALIVAGFLLGIVALLSIRKFGTEGILGRAIVGVVLNGLAVALLVTVVLPLTRVIDVRNQVVGHWQLTNKTDPSIKQLDLTFNKDGSFVFNSTAIDGLQVAMDGKWLFTRNKEIGLDIQHITSGNASASGKKIGLGIVKSVDGQQLVLTTDKGEEIYRRLP